VHVLLDECLPRKLKQALAGHEVRTAQEMGWAGKRNGDLLVLAQAEFDALLTVDRSLSFQQRVSQFEIGVIVLAAPSNTLEALQPLMPEVLRALESLEKRRVLLLGVRT
jgi:predicted nuclease of predicted toxin-antitoxin system